MRRKLIIALVVLLFILVFRLGCGKREGAPPTLPPTRTITPEQILNLAGNRTQPWRLRTTRDVLPGGLSAAMLPLLIAWDRSDVTRPDGYVVVHNLNYGGNPVDGTTVLQTVRIPLDGVERVEFVLVPLGPGGRRAAVHHGQLRFVFRDDRPVVLLDAAPPAAGGDRDLHDLVFSWEAWRAPGQGYDVMTGMDPDAYRLGLRMYAGSQRFLEDALGGRDWFATTLRLPGGEAGPEELLKVVLALGDGVSRHTMSDLLARKADAWLDEAPTGADREKLVAEWRALERLARPRDVADPRLSLSPEERTYQSVLRSCATLAYYCVTVAVDRLAERGLEDGVRADELEPLNLDADQPWMAEVANTNLGGLFLRAPLAVRWLLANPLAVPRNIPGILDKAGLVVHADGEPDEHHYSRDGLSPYGALAGNLIR